MRATLLIIGFSVLCIFLLARFVTWALSDTPQTPVVEKFLTFVEETWRQPLRGPLSGLAALVLAIYFTIVGIGPEKSWTLLKQSWPVLLVFGYYAANYEGCICLMLDPAFFNTIQTYVVEIGSTIIFVLFVFRHCREEIRRSFRRPRRKKTVGERSARVG